MNSVLLVNFVPWRFETGVEHLDLDQQKTWEQSGKAERRRHKTRKMLGNIFHQIDGLLMIFPGEFSKLWCACFISIFIESSEIIRDTRRRASQSIVWIPWSPKNSWFIKMESTEALVLLELLGCRKWKASNSVGKTGETNHQFWGEEVAVAVAALGLNVQKGGLLACCRSLGLGLVLVKELAVVFWSHAGLFLVYWAQVACLLLVLCGSLFSAPTHWDSRIW